MHVEPWQGKLNITFLAVDDEVAFLVACRDGIRYAVAVRIFGQNGGDQGVGAGVLGDKRAVPARELSGSESHTLTDRGRARTKIILRRAKHQRGPDWTYSRSFLPPSAFLSF